MIQIKYIKNNTLIFSFILIISFLKNQGSHVLKNKEINRICDYKSLENVYI